MESTKKVQNGVVDILFQGRYKLKPIIIIQCTFHISRTWKQKVISTVPTLTTCGFDLHGDIAVYNHDPYHRTCGSDTVRFCFGSLIAKELEEFMVTWNHHRITKSNMAETPSGVPDVLYYMPERSGLHHSN